ncbi:ferritin-like domain-containing protein [Leeia sp. TBRC 13508]|uniref:Ferritin-like domain-containing protein n=1 Tax=Leeia speluncae TaxID=2884804 RepID=A0ABS8D9C7_9NEIS|nr:ferritin-like domain-containing protein [Leeia speluncae]MCB6184722.1 ferritin-like domain-containing protein [Leeia speluncae]
MLQRLAFETLCESSAEEKVRLTFSLQGYIEQLQAGELEELFQLSLEEECPGLPSSVILVSPDQVPRRRLGSLHGCAAMLHAVAHIEFNAINLALDVVCRFAGMPKAFYLDWCRVAVEEAYHFSLVSDRLAELGFNYGDFPAHHGLWEMALKTKSDPLARMAMVPRLLEARGLDVTPGLQARMLAAGEKKGAGILDIIFRDEVGHVRVGNYWFRWLCKSRGLDPLEIFRVYLPLYSAPKHRGEMNLEARLSAGFDQDDINVLLAYSNA